jgi:hypothetical protein
VLLVQFLRSWTLWQLLQPTGRHEQLSGVQPWLQRMLVALCVAAEGKMEHPLAGALRSISACSSYPVPMKRLLLCCVAAAGGAEHPAARHWLAELQEALVSALATPELAPGDLSLRDLQPADCAGAVAERRSVPRCHRRRWAQAHQLRAARVRRDEVIGVSGFWVPSGPGARASGPHFQSGEAERRVPSPQSNSAKLLAVLSTESWSP